MEVGIGVYGVVMMWYIVGVEKVVVYTKTHLLTTHVPYFENNCISNIFFACEVTEHYLRHLKQTIDVLINFVLCATSVLGCFKSNLELVQLLGILVKSSIRRLQLHIRDMVQEVGVKCALKPGRDGRSFQGGDSDDGIESSESQADCDDGRCGTDDDDVTYPW